MTFDDYQKQALMTLLDSAGNLTYVTLGLNSESGEVAEKIKKWIRDDDSDPKKLDKAGIISELGDVLWYVAMLAKLLDYNLDEVAQNNLDKLSDRYKRGALHGSGDNR